MVGVGLIVAVGVFDGVSVMVGVFVVVGDGVFVGVGVSVGVFELVGDAVRVDVAVSVGVVVGCTGVDKDLPKMESSPISLQEVIAPRNRVKKANTNTLFRLNIFEYLYKFSGGAAR